MAKAKPKKASEAKPKSIPTRWNPERWKKIQIALIKQDKSFQAWVDEMVAKHLKVK